jgi:SAM-dependent methyltransferase
MRNAPVPFRVHQDNLYRTMFSESAEYYDLIYRSKDYRGEVEKLRNLFAKYAPEARSILDVACGTAEHLRFLSDYQTGGLDIDAAFIQLAKNKLPHDGFHIADMSQFRLGMKFDVILCLFSSIGYLLDDESIRSALSSFKNHLEPTGALFIEPWIEPEAWVSGPAAMIAVEDGERKVCRVMRSKRDGERSFLDAYHLFVNGTDVRYATERHELRLLSREQWFDFFRDAGLRAEYLTDGLTSRGLYVARP